MLNELLETITSTEPVVSSYCLDPLGSLQNKVRCCEIMVDARQYDREFRCRICVYIGLNNCVAAALIPSNAIGNDV